MDDIRLYLPFPPTGNSYYTRTRNGVFISKAGTDFTKAVAEQIMEQASDVKLADPFTLTVILHMPDKRIRDADNYMKGLLDALTKSGIWEDDSLIEHLDIYRGVNIKGGKTRISISEAGFRIPENYWP